MELAGNLMAGWLWTAAGDAGAGERLIAADNASSAEAIEVRKSRSRNRIAGSGSLFPTTSIVVRIRSRRLLDLPFRPFRSLLPAFAISGALACLSRSLEGSS